MRRRSTAGDGGRTNKIHATSGLGKSGLVHGVQGDIRLENACRKTIEDAYAKAVDIMRTHYDDLVRLAYALVDQRYFDAKEVDTLPAELNAPATLEELNDFRVPGGPPMNRTVILLSRSAQGFMRAWDLRTIERIESLVRLRRPVSGVKTGGVRETRAPLLEMETLGARRVDGSGAFIRRAFTVNSKRLIRMQETTDFPL